MKKAKSKHVYTDMPMDAGLLGTDSVKTVTATDVGWLARWDRMSSLSRAASSSVNSASLCLELVSSFSCSEHHSNMTSAMTKTTETDFSDDKRTKTDFSDDKEDRNRIQR